MRNVSQDGSLNQSQPLSESGEDTGRTGEEFLGESRHGDLATFCVPALSLSLTPFSQLTTCRLVYN